MSYSAQRPRGREHIPLFPKGWIAIRIVQLVLAVLILGLAAYGIAAFPTSGNEYILAVAIMTIITSSYHITCEYAMPKAYNYWAILGLDIFLIVMWLASFALLASEVSILYYYLNGFDSYFYSNYVTDYASSVPACLAVAAALGGVQFVLHIASLTIHGIRLHRHRAAGLHCTPGAPRTAPPAAAAYLTTTATSMPGVEKNNHPHHYTQPFSATTQPLAPYPPTQPLAPYPPTQPLSYYHHPGQQQHQQQQVPPIQQLYGAYVPQQGQVPVAVSTTGMGGYPQQQQEQEQEQGGYQQGNAVPLFEQRTGGSVVGSPGEQQPQQQHQQQQQQFVPATVAQPQPQQTELPGTQIQVQQQQQQQQQQ